VGTDPPPVASAARWKAQLLREEQGHAHGAPLRWWVAARDRWDRLDRARPGRAAFLLRQRRGGPSFDDGSLRRSRLGGGGPGRRRTLRGSTPPLHPFGGGATARSIRCFGARWNGPRSGGSRRARAAPGGSTTSTMDDLPSWRGPCGRLRGSPRTALLGSVARDGGNLVARPGFGRHTRGFGLECRSRRSLLARDETVASTGSAASADGLDGAIPQTDRRPMQNKPAYHTPRGVHSEGGKPARRSNPWESPSALTPCQSSLRGGSRGPRRMHRSMEGTSVSIIITRAPGRVERAGSWLRMVGANNPTHQCFRVSRPYTVSQPTRGSQGKAQRGNTQRTERRGALPSGSIAEGKTSTASNPKGGFGMKQGRIDAGWSNTPRR